MRDKLILVDCDGVLLDWGFHFTRWLAKHDYVCVNPDCYDIAEMYGLEKKEAKRLVRMFNESATIRKVSPLRDAVKYVRKLHEEHGYIFHAITSLSNDEYAQHLRTKNLRELFGPTVFDKYVYLDCGADKDEALSEYQGTDCYWIEDKPENAVVGSNFALDALLMDHTHNRDFEHANVRRVRNWKEIYNIIVGE